MFLIIKFSPAESFECTFEGVLNCVNRLRLDDGGVIFFGGGAEDAALLGIDLPGRAGQTLSECKPADHPRKPARPQMRQLIERI